jgi:hypothetical protein
MHRFIFALAASTALIVSGPAYAQHGGPKTTPTAHGQSSTHGSSGATTHGSSGATTHGNSGATTTKPTSSTTTHGSGNTHASGGGNPHSSGGTSTTTKSGTTTTGTSPTTTGTGSGTTVTLTPVQQKLQKNTNLADKLRTRLPANTDLMDAAKGFRNLGQFVAAVNVSNNLGLDFTQLKTRMVDDGMSLGQAIQKQKTTVDVDTEVHRAETEADSMIKTTTTSTATPQPFPTPTTTTKKTKKTSGNQ